MNTSKKISEYLKNLDINGQEIKTLESIAEKFKVSNAKGDNTRPAFGAWRLAGLRPLKIEGLQREVETLGPPGYS